MEDIRPVRYALMKNYSSNNWVTTLFRDIQYTDLNKPTSPYTQISSVGGKSFKIKKKKMASTFADCGAKSITSLPPDFSFVSEKYAKLNL